jgi:pilus assembly protein CpaC
MSRNAFARVVAGAVALLLLAGGVSRAQAPQQPASLRGVSVSQSQAGHSVVEVLFTGPVTARVADERGPDAVVRVNPARVSVSAVYPVSRHGIKEVRIRQAGPVEVEIRVVVSEPGAVKVEVGQADAPSERVALVLSRKRDAPEVALGPGGRGSAIGSAAEELPQGGGVLELVEGRSRLLAVPGLKRVAVSNPQVADVVTVSDRELVLNGLKPGEATLIVWQGQGSRMFTVSVAPAKPSEQEVALRAFRAMLPDGVRAIAVGRSLLLSGAVQDQVVKERILAAARAAVKDQLEVVDQIEVKDPIQVQLEVRIVEVSRSSLSELGLSWGMTFQPQAPSGGVFLAPVSTDRQFLQDAFYWIVSGGLFPPSGYELFFRLLALVQRGQARVVASPNVVTMAGKEAKLVVGGQIPVPGQGGNVEYRPFGVVVTATPEVDGSGRITLKLQASSSDLDFSRVVQVAGGQLPTLVDRSVSTQVSMASGEVLGIGGLIARVNQEILRKFPILGDIPILGELFRSRSYQTQETEVVFLVSPKILPSRAQGGQGGGR